ATEPPPQLAGGVIGNSFLLLEVNALHAPGSLRRAHRTMSARLRRGTALGFRAPRRRARVSLPGRPRPPVRIAWSRQAHDSLGATPTGPLRSVGQRPVTSYVAILRVIGYRPRREGCPAW